jgi:hypothetical protein
MTTDLVSKLNRAYGRRIGFQEAAIEVTGGADLDAPVPSTRSVAIAKAGTFVAAPAELEIGRAIADGHREELAHCELRCFVARQHLAVAVFDREGQAISRVLRARSRGVTSCDEGLFAWFGPLEYVLTPWSDNDPPQCQVVTIDSLRRFAAAWTGAPPPPPPPRKPPRERRAPAPRPFRVSLADRAREATATRTPKRKRKH